jgi:RNA polymerase sigma factor (sigma-70 family)
MMNKRGGAPDGFEERLDSLYALARRAAYRILGDGAGADDVAEETMVRAYARWWSVAGHAEAWVTRVASNLAISEWRHRRSAIEARRFADRSAVSLDNRSVDRVDLSRVIAQLPRRQREVVTLRYLMDMPEAEVAEVLRCSPGTVSRHTARGLARLRVLMTPPVLEVPTDV